MKVLSMIAIAVALVSVIVPLILSYLFGGQMAVYVSPPYGFKDIPDLTGKVAIVTGSNTGIGYVTARELARKGAKVIIAARSAERGADAAKKIKAEIGNVPGADLVEFMKLDLSSFAAVRKFAKDFSYKRIPLNMLILNAGVMGVPYTATTDGIEMTIGTNHFGHFLLVKLLTPIIKSSKARIVHVSSLGHIFSYPEGIRFETITSDVGFDSFTAYGQSKLANILFSNELARQLNGTGVTSNSLHPGSIKTELQRYYEESMSANWFSRLAFKIVGSAMGTMFMSVDNGALTQLYVATSPQIAGVTGQYFIPIGIKSKTSAHAMNVTMQKKLWQESERLTKPFW